MQCEVSGVVIRRRVWHYRGYRDGRIREAACGAAEGDGGTF